MGIVTTALFGFRAVAETVELDVGEVVGMVRSGHGDIAGMVFSRNRPPGDAWERSSVQPTRSPSTSTGTNSSDQSTRSPDHRLDSSAASISQARSCAAFVPQQTPDDVKPRETPRGTVRPLTCSNQ